MSVATVAEMHDVDQGRIRSRDGFLIGSESREGAFRQEGLKEATTTLQSRAPTQKAPLALGIKLDSATMNLALTIPLRTRNAKVIFVLLSLITLSNSCRFLNTSCPFGLIYLTTWSISLTLPLPNAAMPLAFGLDEIYLCYYSPHRHWMLARPENRQCTLTQGIEYQTDLDLQLLSR